VFYGSPGDVVRSATSGEVKWAATYWTRGKVVIIKSNDGTLFTYGGNAELLVNVGDRVSAGMDIAKLGESPQGGGAKLYFSISDSSGRAMNPERYLSSKSDS
jgi:septal ring factor EnvC (AmiA/AmiB activator)